MTDLIAEVAEVVRLQRLVDATYGCECENAMEDRDNAAVNFLRTHHAEIEAMARDAQLWRKFSERVDPDKIPGGFTVYLNCDGYDELLYDATSLSAAMHDSAREGGE